MSLFFSRPYHEVADVGDEAEGLSYNQDGIVAYDAIGDDAQGANKGQDPEEGWKF